MVVLDRSELEASPLADLHAIADQIGLDGFRRLRKADLIDAILGESGGEAAGEDAATASGEDQEDQEDQEEEDTAEAAGPTRARSRRGSRSRTEPAEDDEDEQVDSPDAGATRARSRRGGRSRVGRGEGEEDGRAAAGVVEVLGNGSAFLRVDPPDPSDEDVYISAAQVRRCELVSGDRVAGPVRLPRRSERYPSLVRIDTINGASADEVSEGARYEDLPVEYPGERLALGASDRTLEAIEWLTPLGRGSRAVIVGAPRAGKTETLRRLQAALSGRE